MNFQTIVGIALGIFVFSVIMSIPYDEVEEVETYFTYEPYAHEKSLVRVNQVRKFPWFHEVTQAQYIVKNNDAAKGTFGLNFIFDNGMET